MKKFISVRAFVLFAILLGASTYLLYAYYHEDTPTWTTDTVSEGPVRNVISVSGSIDAVGSANLAFSEGGIVERVLVREGDTVQEGQTLATLIHSDLIADRKDAEAALLIAQSDLALLNNGIRKEARDISETTAAIAKEDLMRITKEHDDRVYSAYRTLLSEDLEARPLKSTNDATPPHIQGTYTCEEGAYSLTLFRSGTQSGYSYRLGGIESGTFTVYTESGAPLGNCGLTIQFFEGENYGTSEWVIEIPNSKSSTYLANKNAYTLAVTERTNAIAAAEQALMLAEQTTLLETALPLEEERAQKEAHVLQAEARLAVVESQIQNHILSAPFPGTITTVEPVTGEAVGTTPVITMVSNDAFSLDALIPEIDITKVLVGQRAEVVFDAKQDTVLPASVMFISPLAKEIDGVSYFEAKLHLEGEIPWLRSGLNADIDIIIESREQSIRIPKRYLIARDGSYIILTPRGTVAEERTVTVPFIGNDGYAVVEGITPGTTIISP